MCAGPNGDAVKALAQEPTTRKAEAFAADIAARVADVAIDVPERLALAQDVTAAITLKVATIESALIRDATLHGALLQACSDKKSPEVGEAALEALLALAKSTNDFVAGELVPSVLNALDPKERWQTQVAAAKTLTKLSACAPQVTSSLLTTILPVVTSMVNDAKQEVADAAREALSALCHTIDNRDVEPFIDSMVAATVDHEQTDECVQ